MNSQPLTLDLVSKAQTLIEALPWFKSAWGSVVVVKYGGAAMTDANLCAQVASDIVLMKLAGVHPVVVHGGGPEITAFQERLGYPVKFINGYRATPPEVMDIVKMVLVGKVNKDIVNAINEHGTYAVGISGEDGGLVKGRSISDELGRAGEVVSIDTTVVQQLIDDDFIPVIATSGRGLDGQSLNINADLVAGKLAEALQADKCIYLTDVNGIYADFDDPGSLIPVMTPEAAEDFALNNDAAVGGMLPKIRACVEAVKGGVRRAFILNGTVAHSVILEMYTTAGIGTMISYEVDDNE